MVPDSLTKEKRATYMAILKKNENKICPFFSNSGVSRSWAAVAQSDQNHDLIHHFLPLSEVAENELFDLVNIEQAQERSCSFASTMVFAIQS